MAAGTNDDGPVVLTNGSQDPIQELLDIIVQMGATQVTAIGDAGSAIPEDVMEQVARGRDIERVEGDGMFETSANIAANGWPDGADTVYLAESVDLADGLAGGTLQDGPILLVPDDGDLPTVTSEAIESLDPERVVSLGGEDAISDSILDQAADGRDTERLEGLSRFETAAAVSAEVFPDGAERVYLARADIAPDAVVAGSVTDGPILLVESCNGVHPGDGGRDRASGCHRSHRPRRGRRGL